MPSPAAILAVSISLFSHYSIASISPDLLLTSEAKARPPPQVSFVLQEASKAPVRPVQRGPIACTEARRDTLKQLEGRRSASPTPIYLPQCDPRDESLYERLQCHGKTVCWCVDIHSGEPVTDECEGSTAAVEIQSAAASLIPKKRDIKRCSKPEKLARFYKRLFATFAEEQQQSSSAAQSIDKSIIIETKSSPISLKDTSKQRAKIQQAVLWKFKSLDKNGNEIIERSEWRGYRKAIRMWQGVRTCARNFFRFCDADLNRKITPDEWRDCTFPRIGLALVEKPPPVNPFISGMLAEDKSLQGGF